MNLEEHKYSQLINEIGSLLQKGRKQAAEAINTALVQTYWLIGKHIVEYEQGGKETADYGKQLLDKISAPDFDTGTPKASKCYKSSFIREAIDFCLGVRSIVLV